VFISADYGKDGGGVIEAITKSGSNQLHGSLFELHRDAAFDAKNYFDLANLPIPPFVRNQFGASIGWVRLTSIYAKAMTIPLAALICCVHCTASIYLNLLWVHNPISRCLQMARPRWTTPWATGLIILGGKQNAIDRAVGKRIDLAKGAVAIAREDDCREGIASADDSCSGNIKHSIAIKVSYDGRIVVCSRQCLFRLKRSIAIPKKTSTLAPLITDTTRSSFPSPFTSRAAFT
jgi:hypothetical protein